MISTFQTTFILEGRLKRKRIKRMAGRRKTDASDWLYSKA
ncbi:hypothetical protein NEIMUCOT_06362 [Neisseria mucosa ATCC 25996]|uniref:Uncharacterized protein n=1 Tax=Neisseria mucosa (strain ATCC 25996 / DSM 4631 / NCTC 10774 / M26) TaxID=546266 RepID=D3A0C7_NEIM2|nr:hypothetical protein NEIMUCOT_06362 [Neisseria mucosa ATCC 25996]